MKRRSIDALISESFPNPEQSEFATVRERREHNWLSCDSILHTEEPEPISSFLANAASTAPDGRRPARRF